MSGFRVIKYKVKTADGKKGADRPFSVVFLSDLHNVSYGEHNSMLLAEIRNQDPGAVFISGDLLVSSQPKQTEEALFLLGELTKQYPVYYVNGNHEQRMKEYTDRYGDDYRRYSEAVRSTGTHLLENTFEQLELHHMRITVWGYELPIVCYHRGRKKELMKEQLEEAFGARPGNDSYHILLAHNPVYFPVYSSWGADLTLSGHLHGGMVRLPFLGGVISPQMRLFPDYSRGLYEKNGKKMIVSAGLGSHTIRLRINNPPELVVIDFV